jgi:hypothetical protein
VNIWLRGEPNSVMLPIASAKAAAAGSMVGFTGGTTVLASDTTWDTNIATTQTAFALLFAGICVQDKDADEDVFGHGGDFALKVRVATSGVFLMACAAGTYAVGDLVGPKKATGDDLEDAIVDLSSTEARSIGRVVGRAGVNPGHVEVEINSRVFRKAPSIT